MRITDDGKFVIKLDGTDRFRMTSSSNKLMIEPLANNNSLYFGNNAGLNANTSDYNTAIGYNTLKNVGLSGNYNTAFGSEALTTNTTGSYNTAVGRNALKNNVNGNGNTAIGANSMFAFTSGNNNTAFGFRSLNDCIDGDFNTALGNNSDVSSIGMSYGTAIGPRSMVTQSHSMILGSIAGINGAVESVKVGFSASNPQAILHVRRFAGGSDPIVCIEEDALDFSRIRFKNTNSSNEWSINGKAAQMDADARFNFRYTQDILSLRGDGDAVLAGVLTQTSDKRLKKNIKPIQFHPSVLDSIHAYHYYWKDENRSNKLQLGFLAQEVENIYPHLVNENEGVKGLNYTGFVPLLIEGVKVQDKQNQALETRLLSIHKELLNLTTTLNQFK
jgi:hypothetical protein